MSCLSLLPAVRRFKSNHGAAPAQSEITDSQPEPMRISPRSVSQHHQLPVCAPGTAKEIQGIQGPRDPGTLGDFHE